VRFADQSGNDGFVASEIEGGRLNTQWASAGPSAWDRQPQETARQFARFATYRDLHPLHRSLAEVGRLSGVSNAYLERLSGRNNWVPRVDAYDAEQDRQDQAQRSRRIREMNCRHAEIAGIALDKVKTRLLSIDPDTLRPTEVARLLEIAAKAERVARGVLPDEPDVHEYRPVLRADLIRQTLKAEGLI